MLIKSSICLLGMTASGSVGLVDMLLSDFIPIDRTIAAATSIKTKALLTHSFQGREGHMQTVFLSDRLYCVRNNIDYLYQ